ncbi:hypothetical protein BGZ95_001999 [Linnemannia exigua]|uniref:Uncharacterized protein n=1 Tax=Linnemannia exigua TaxID=604196 RepID=A0AAD4D6J3_9FUNG|nr:hypothetical protein BGZ95_001999 [Linnemannia exigua]
MNPSCSAPGQDTRPTAQFQRTLIQQQSSKTVTRTKTITSTAIFLLACLALLSTVSAAITCALPAGGTYKAGDGIILDWGSDGFQPTVDKLVSVNGSLFCNTGVSIAQFPIPVLTGSYNWTLPSVGNATTVGGTVGTCTGNAFHMEYSGMYTGFLGLGPYPWGPVRCGTITILPAPNGTITTTTTTMTSTTTTSSTPSATETSGNSSGGGLSTTIIVVIAVVAAVLVTLSIVALVVCSRKRRRQRKLNNALMPWNSTLNSNNHPPSTTNNNGFSKIASSVDDEPRPHNEVGSGSGSGSGNVAGERVSGASAVGGAGLTAFALKAQPMVPQPSQNQYYGDDGDYGNYGYQQQQQQLLQQQQQQRQEYQQQGYDGYNEEEDAYYNPYYATGGMGPTTAAVVNQSNQSSFYNHHSGGGNGGVGAGSHMRLSFLPDPYQSSPDMYQMQQQRSFYPPPPVGLMTTSPNAPNATIGLVARNPERNRPGISSPAGQELGPLGSALTSLPTANSSESSSPRRGPQVVMAEMGRKEAEKAEKTDKAEAEGGAEDSTMAEVGNEKVPLQEILSKKVAETS